MANKFLIKRSSVASKNPATTDLSLGELALNTYDGNLFFKKSPSGVDAIVTVDTTDGVQTLTNKTLSSVVLTGTLTVNGTAGTNGQYLKSTGTGLTWASPPNPSLSSLTDVVISSPAINQVLTYTGSAWVNQASNVQVASAVFGSTLYDMGFVYDSVVISEDEGLITTTASYIYDLGVLSFTGIISLNNLDQSVKSDYLGYSIIFGF
jgi:hypothetical protein